MKKKLHIIQILRLMVQIGFLILLPGLFSQVFGEMKMIVTALVDGSFNFMEMLPNMIELAIIIPLTILFGRFFCGWMCAFGTYNDLVYGITKKLFGKKLKFKMNSQVDKALKSLKYIILGAIVVGIWILGFKMPAGSNPWDAFGMIPEFSTAFPTYMIGYGILAVITIGAAFVERFFCRYLCPLGATFGIISKFRMTSIQKPTAQCGNCRACTNSCSMGIDLYKNEKIKDEECTYCMKCVETCPKKNAKVNILGAKVNASLASAAAIIGFIGMYSASGVLADAAQMNQAVTTDTANTTIDATTGTIASSNTTTESTASSAVRNAASTVTTAAKKYKDGTYTGTGVGFRPGTKVSVTIKNSKITSIKVTATKDDRPFYQRAYTTVIKNIISKQKTNVASVSGATYSSEGVKSAVANALAKAKI